jgi:hypothetical protein
VNTLHCEHAPYIENVSITLSIECESRTQDSSYNCCGAVAYMSTLFIIPGKEYSYFVLFDRCYQHKFLAQGNDGKKECRLLGRVGLLYTRTAPHPRRRHSSYSPPLKDQILHKVKKLYLFLLIKHYAIKTCEFNHFRYSLSQSSAITIEPN